MNIGILLPVYCREGKAFADQPNYTATKANGIQFFYKLQDLYARWSVGTEENDTQTKKSNVLIGEALDTSNAFWKKGLNKISLINNTFHEYLSPVLEKNGLEIYYTKSIPKDIDNHFDGTVRWGIRPVNYAAHLRSRSRDSREVAGIISLLHIEAGVGQRVITEFEERHIYSLYIDFVVRLRSVPHLEHLKIPSHGVGAELFLEDIFAMLENNIFASVRFQSWHDQLVWFCKMIVKHKDILFKPLPSSLGEAIFNSIRSRAIKVEN